MGVDSYRDMRTVGRSEISEKFFVTFSIVTLNLSSNCVQIKGSRFSILVPFYT